MRFFLFFLSIGIMFSFSSYTRHLHRLTNLYYKNPDKCLSTSLRLQKWDGNSPVPYMFAAIVYLDKSKENKSFRSTYSALGKSFNQAVQFEKFQNKELAVLKLWENYKQHLDSISTEFYHELEEKSCPDLVRSLERKRTRMGFGNLNELSEKNELEENENVPETINTESDANVVGSTAYFGLPNGYEKVVSYSRSEEQMLLDLINEERVSQGMRPLVWEEKLAEAARYHSCDMATQNYFNHDSYDRIDNHLIKVGKTFDRIRKFYSDSFVNSENIAAGNAGADHTYKQWYNSSGHYKNMFNPESAKCGIGVYYDPNSTYQYYWSFCTAK